MRNHAVLYAKNSNDQRIDDWSTVQSNDDITLVIHGRDENLHEVKVKAHEWLSFCSGIHIQDAFPKHSADDRELILSGITASLWQEYFYDPEDYAD